MVNLWLINVNNGNNNIINISYWWFGTFFFHILGFIIPTDFHIFQRGWNHQPDMHIQSYTEVIPYGCLWFDYLIWPSFACHLLFCTVQPVVQTALLCIELCDGVAWCSPLLSTLPFERLFGATPQRAQHSIVEWQGRRRRKGHFQRFELVSAPNHPMAQWIRAIYFVFWDWRVYHAFHLHNTQLSAKKRIFWSCPWLHDIACLV